MASRPTATIAIALLLSLTAVAVMVMVPGGGRAGGTPLQIHLSWQQKSTTGRMSVVWATATPSVASQVRLGVTIALELGYRSADTYPMPNEAGPYLHHALLSSLRSGTRYYYAVGDNTTGWSPVLSFRTGPAGQGNFTFVAAADTGVGSTAAANVARMVEANPALAVDGGDLSYANGDEPLWDQWFNQLQPLASRVPYMPSPGNHDYEAAYGLKAYLGRFALPRNERYYSFNYSSVHFISLDGGPLYNTTISGTKTAWLEKDLRYNSQDTKHPWTVVVFHFPPFTSGSSQPWWAGRATWSPLFDKYGVEMVINGHDHDYERSWPVYASGVVAQRNYSNPRAPVYVVTGGGGEELYPFPSTVTPGWSAFRALTFETLRVAVNGSKMTVRAIRPDGSQLDAFTITKGTPPTAGGSSNATLTVKVKYPDGTAVPWGWVEVWDGSPWSPGSKRLFAGSNQVSTYPVSLARNWTYYIRAWGDANPGYLGEKQVYLTADTELVFIDPSRP